ncbi:MAG: divergent polysaccharide deacetylase family protein [Candidatus Acidiferrales bacterium]
MAAAQKVGGRDAEIVIRPEMGARQGERAQLVADDIFVNLPDAAKAPAVEGALDRAAARYHLAHVPHSSSSGVIRFDYLLNGRRTQSIHISVSNATNANRAGTKPGSGPRLAIIIDDLGNDLAPAEALLKIRYPLTLSILPSQLHSAEIADEAFRRGDQVMLHLPMEFEGNAAKPEAIELRVGMGASEVDRLLAQMIEAVPHAAGINNHEGSRATTDPALMADVMAVLRQRNLFFIDSRTTAATVAYDAARQAGVRAASRNVFLDDIETREAILRQIELAKSDATREGSAIAIGHPHPATIAALEQALPQLKARGVRLVFASALVH